MKFVLLHVRDCDESKGGCGYPWCPRVKGLIRHVLDCDDPERCDVCSGDGLPENLKEVRSDVGRGAKWRGARSEATMLHEELLSSLLLS